VSVSTSLNDFAPPTGVAMSPTPTDEEAAAIMAATEALWPRPVILAATTPTRRNTSWRFSGRWWNKPIAARRERP
jgi:hypothetical protein